MNQHKGLERIISMLLVLCVCISMLPATVFAVEPNVLYVDGVGNTADHYVTLKEALQAVPDNNDTTYIVIQTAVNAGDGITNIQTGADYYKEGFLDGGTAVKLPKHSGTVILTAQDPKNDNAVANGAGLNLSGFTHVHFSGDFVFQNIAITGVPTYLYTDYHNLTLGDGVTGVAINKLFLGKNGVGFTGWTAHDVRPADVSFTMKSGKVLNLYGGSRAVDSAAKSVNITIDGGTVETVFGAGCNDTSRVNTHTGDIKVTVNDGTVTNVYGTSKGTTVTGNVAVSVNGGTVTAVYGVSTDATVSADAAVSVKNATLSNLYLSKGTVTGNVNALVESSTITLFKGVEGSVGGDVYVKTVNGDKSNTVGKGNVSNLVEATGIVGGSVYFEGGIPTTNVFHMMKNVNAYATGAQITGDKVICCNGFSGTNYTTYWTNFDTLKLTGGANLLVRYQGLWEQIQKVIISDDSLLKLHKDANCTKIVVVQVIPSSGDTLTAGGILIEDWSGSASAVTFTTDSTEYSLLRQEGTNITWKLELTQVDPDVPVEPSTPTNPSEPEDPIVPEDPEADALPEQPDPEGAVLYVDGIGGTEGHYATLAEAISAVAPDNEVTYIVVKSSVDATAGIAPLGNNHVKLPAHKGQIIITSKYGDEDYTATAKLDLGAYLHLSGDTKFKHIAIIGNLHLYADFNDLYLGKGILLKDDDKIADNLYLGTDINAQSKTTASPAAFIMESGAVGNLYGGSRKVAASDAVSITISGGTVAAVYGAGFNGPESSVHNGNISITVNNGMVDAVTGVSKNTIVTGDVSITVGGAVKHVKNGVIGVAADGTVNGNLYVSVVDNTVGGGIVPGSGTLKGKPYIAYYNVESGTLSGKYSGFTGLYLVTSKVAVPADSALWDGITDVRMTTDSTLTLTDAVIATDNSIVVELVSVKDAQDDHVLISAPAGSVNKFSVKDATFNNMTYDGTGATWKLVKVKDEFRDWEYADGPIFYVNGTETKADANEYKTLAEALKAVSETNEVTYIVIKGTVNALDGMEALPDRLGQPSENYRFPIHQGIVVITSIRDDENYLETAELKLGTDTTMLHLGGNTVFKNIRITQKVKHLYAGYSTLHLAKGIDCGEGVIADTIYMGTNSAIGTNATIQNSIFTMDSGVVGSIYGGGNSFQGANERGADYDVMITINGGTVQGYVYGTGAGVGGTAVQKNVTINVTGGSVGNIHGCDGGASVYGDVRINIAGGIVKSVNGARKANPTETYTPSVLGDIWLNITPGTVANNNFKGMEDGANVKGKCYLVYENVAKETLSNVNNINGLKLVGSTVTVKKEAWEKIQHLIISEDSVLTLQDGTSTAKVEVGILASGAEKVTPGETIIEAPANMTDIFTVTSPLGIALEKKDDGTVTTWTLIAVEVDLGSTGTDAGQMDVDLGFGDSYTPLDPNASAYDSYLQKREDLGDAKNEANIIGKVPVQGQWELYIDPVKGSDTNNGSKEKPFATIEKALSLIQPLQEYGAAGIVIYLRGGDYHVDEPITLNQVHSGRNGIPVIISAYPGEEVVFTGGYEIKGSDFTVVTDPAVLAKLSETVHGKIYQYDLKKLGLEDFGTIQEGASGGPTYQVSMNSTSMYLARYPDAGALRVGKVWDEGYKGMAMSGDRGNPESPGPKFGLTDTRPLKWENTGSIYLYGSIYEEWDTCHHLVGNFDADRIAVQLLGDGRYGTKDAGTNLHYYYNIFEELTMPGEFFLDTSTGILYVYPIVDMANATVTYSKTTNDVFSLNNVENFVLNGLAIENSYGTGVKLSGCNQVVIQNCELRNVNYGLQMTKCSHSGIIYSEIHDTYNYPIFFNESYDMYDYTKQYNFVQNCYVYSAGTANPKYCSIMLKGTGNVVSHNLIQGGYSVGIYAMQTKECIIEYNEIVGNPTGTFDSGAIYIPYYHGNVGNHIRFNYIHDTGLFSNSIVPSAIYLDVNMTDVYVYGNVLENVLFGVQGNAGANNVIIDNVMVNSREKTLYSINIHHYWEDVADNLNFSFKEGLQKWEALTSAERAEIQKRYPTMDRYLTMLQDKKESGAWATEKSLIRPYGIYISGNITYNYAGVVYVAQQNETDGCVVKDNIAFLPSGTKLLDHIHVKPMIMVYDVKLFQAPASPTHDYTLTTEGAAKLAEYGFTCNAAAVVSKAGVDTAQNPCVPFKDQILNSITLNGVNDADPYKLAFRWTAIAGADTYTVKISRNPDMSDPYVFKNLWQASLSLDTDTFFDFDKTYYWTVEAQTTSINRGDDYKHCGTVYTFKTMDIEEYLERNEVDKTKLEAAIAEAKAFLNAMKEEKDGGSYENGSKSKLQAAIDAAQAVADNRLSTQTAVDQATVTMRSAIDLAVASRTMTYITIPSMDPADWIPIRTDITFPNYPMPEVNQVSGTLQFKREGDGNRGQLTYKNKIGITDVMCFKMRIDQISQWCGFVLAQNDPSLFFTEVKKGATSYSILFHEDGLAFELQCNVATIEYKRVPDLLKNGEWVDVQIGAINKSDGSVRVLFKINGTTVFDHIFTGRQANTGAGYFGVVVQPMRTNGATYLMPVSVAHLNGTTGGSGGADGDSGEGDIIVTPELPDLPDMPVVEQPVEEPIPPHLEAAIELSGVYVDGVIKVTRANGLKLTRKALRLLSENNLILELNSKGKTVILDNAALQHIYKTTQFNVTLTVEELELANLTDAQRAAIGDYPVGGLIAVRLTSKNKTVTDLGDGTITVTVPFTPAEGTNAAEYCTYVMGADGSLTLVSVTHSDEKLAFQTNAVADYAILHNPEDVAGEDTGSRKVILIVTVSAVAVLAAAVVVIILIRKKRK